LKKLIFFAIAFIVVFLVALNSSAIADQAVAWVKEHPKDEHAPELLYRAARWCDILGDNNKALEIYWNLYQQYPEKGQFCAPALYYSAKIKVDVSGVKAQADPFLEIVMNQYPGQNDWGTKAKKLYDEVHYVH
jgi:hypothetical protein